MSSHDRRRFLRELARRAVQASAELEAALQPREEPPPPGYAGERVESPPLPAAPATRTASLADVSALCAEVGRPEWADAAASGARLSFRLTPGRGGGRLGDDLVLPADVEAPTVDGRRLRCVLRLPLDELPSSPLPATGTLLVFANIEHEPCVRVLLAEAEASAGDAPGLPVAASAELTLPPDPAQPQLEADDLADWLLLRERLAAAQGVELEELSPDRHTLHRLLGHPDTVGSQLDLEVELLARGLDPTDAAAALEVPEAELARAAAEWRLLLQLGGDPQAGFVLPDDARLYVWIRERDLLAARFESTRALVR